jgi:hypothetical protein
MPEQETIRRARKKQREGKAPSTQASEFVREEMHHVAEGKHGASSREQTIAIGLSKARKAGVKVPARGAKRASSPKPSPETGRAGAAPRARTGQKRTAHKRAAATTQRTRTTTSALTKTARKRSAARPSGTRMQATKSRTSSRRVSSVTARH